MSGFSDFKKKMAWIKKCYITSSKKKIIDLATLFDEFVIDRFIYHHLGMLNRETYVVINDSSIDNRCFF